MSDDTPAIVFEAAVNGVRTLADGGIRVMLDLPEDSIPAMAQLAACKREGIYLNVVCTATYPTETKNERKSTKF